MGCTLLLLFYSEQNLKTDVVVHIIILAAKKLRHEGGKLEASLGYSMRLFVPTTGKEKTKPGSRQLLIILVLRWGAEHILILHWLDSPANR